MLRIRFRPFGESLVRMVKEGPTDDGNAVMERSLSRTKPWVLALWACVLLQAFLGVFQPFDPEEVPAAAGTGAQPVELVSSTLR